MTVFLKKDVVNLDEIIVESGLVSKSYLNSTNSITLIRLDEIRESGADHLQNMIKPYQILIGQEVQVDQGISS